MLALVLLVNRSGTMVIPFLALYLTGPIGMTEAAAGRMISVYGLGAICGASLGGRLSASWDPAYVQVTSLTLGGLGFFAIPWAGSSTALVATLFLTGAVAEALRPANATMVAHATSPELRSRAYGLQRLALNLGLSIGPAIGGVLATIDFRWLFLVDGVTSLAAAAAFAKLFRVHKRSETVHRKPSSSAARSPLGDRFFLAYLAIALVNALVFFQFTSTYPLYLRDHYQLTKPQIGGMYAVNTATVVACEMMVVSAVSSWPLLRTIGWGFLLTSTGFGVLPFGSSGAYCVLAMLVLTVGEMLSASLSAGFVSTRGKGGAESRYLSCYVVTMSLAAVLGPAIGTAIYQTNPDAVWYAGLAVGVLTWGAMRCLERTA